MWVLFIFAGVAIFLIVKAVRGHSRRVTAAWNAAAAQLGMTFDPGSLTRKKNMHGIVNGNRIEIATITRSAGSKGQHTATRYRVHYPAPLVQGLQLKPQGLFSKAAAFLGAQNIETGDKDFDARVAVKGSIPNRVVGFLTHERRREVLRLFDEFKGVKIDDQLIEWSKSSVPKNATDIVSTVESLSSAASLLSGGDAGTEALEGVVVPMAAAATAAALMDAANKRRPAVEAPALPQSVWSSSIPAPSEPAVVSAPAAAAPAADLAAAEVAAQLFTRGITSTEAKRRFEERYKGKRVRWSGSLRRAAGYSVDITFKGGPGTKATFALAVAADGALGGAVQAVVQLAPAAAAELRSRVGEEIAFEGRLMSCETLVRSFNIADARLS
jgi:hypothetical protein